MPSKFETRGALGIDAVGHIGIRREEPAPPGQAPPAAPAARCNHTVPVVRQAVCAARTTTPLGAPGRRGRAPLPGSL